LETRSGEPNSAEEQRRAANGYLLWPLALANLVREGDTETGWSRIHARQALLLGLTGTIGVLVVMALPLFAVIVTPAITPGATIAVYGVGLIADVIAAALLAAAAIRSAARAARGELFTIPLITPLVDRWLGRS
jgi:uncharacterized membrane protein